MAIDHKVWSFPTFRISKQLFHVPGAAIDGGLTSGGARITSPEPGGFSMLEIQPSLQVNERAYPLSSWLMSKTNGQILRVRLAPTPQVASALAPGTPWGAGGIYPDAPWSNLQNWSGDLSAQYAAAALPGSNVVKIDMTALGPVLQHGHVIGHQNTTYLVDDIEYSETGVATITVTPPLRDPVAVGDPVFFRPWFTGLIVNGSEFRTTYDAVNAGHIQLNNIQLREVVL